jgi:hypothetical protein
MFYNYKDDILLSSSLVIMPIGGLITEDKDTYQYPVEGWYWFDTLEEAKQFFDIED